MQEERKIVNFSKALENVDVEHKKAIRLLGAAQNILTNQIGHCNKSNCTERTPCIGCEQCRSLHKTIEEYLREK